MLKEHLWENNVYEEILEILQLEMNLKIVFKYVEGIYLSPFELFGTVP